MSQIKLKNFAGLRPRTGEQVLPPGTAVRATNTDLDSGALRPLIAPHLEHVFPRAGEPGFLSPNPVDPSTPNPEPPEPPGCVPVEIITPPADYFAVIVPDEIEFSVVVNSDASGPVVIRWYVDDILQAGQTGTTLTLLPAALQNEYNNGELVLSPNIPVLTRVFGVVKVEVTNPCGSDVARAQIGITPNNAPECQPYDCKAYIQAVENAGYSTLGLNRPTLLESFDWPFATSLNDDKPRVYNQFTASPNLFTDWSVQYGKADATNWFGGQNSPNWCGGKAANVVNLTGPTTADTAILLPNNENNSGLGGDWFVTAIVAPHDGGTTMHRNIARCINKRWSILFTSYPQPYFFTVGTAGAHITSPTTIVLSMEPTDTETYTIPSLLNRWSLVTVAISSSEPYEQQTVGSPVGYNDVLVDVVVRASVNGQTFTKSKAVRIATTAPHSQIVTLSRIQNTLYSQSRMFSSQSRNESISVMEMATSLTSEEVDLDALELGFLRNFIGYTPPDYCGRG